MSDYNWCHGPECHITKTQSRIRGSGTNKVLRTIKIKHNSSYRSHDRYSMFNYFCGNSCLYDFIRLHLQSLSQNKMEKVQLEKQSGQIKSNK